MQRVFDYIDPFPSFYRNTLAGLDRSYTQSASLVLTNSAYSRETIYRIYGIFSQIAYLGVDIERFLPLMIARKNYVLSVGALVPNKGFDFIVRSLACINPTHRPQLILVSNSVIPKEREYLDRLASELGVSVIFRTLITDKELVNLYNEALLTVYAPVMEPFGFVPLESMACGTPVVGVCEAGVRESVIDGRTGFLTERNTRDFAVAIQRLIDDEMLRSKFGNESREYVLANWQWEYRVNNIEKQLSSVLSKS